MVPASVPPTPTTTGHPGSMTYRPKAINCDFCEARPTWFARMAEKYLQCNTWKQCQNDHIAQRAQQIGRFFLQTCPQAQITCFRYHHDENVKMFLYIVVQRMLASIFIMLESPSSFSKSMKSTKKLERKGHHSVESGSECSREEYERNLLA